MSKPGFVIADLDDVAMRNGMQAASTGHISSTDLDRRQQNLVHVFQYLIGNTESALQAAQRA